MKIEFLMCGNANDAFLSQAAIFRYSLDSLGGIYRDARLTLCLGAAHAPSPISPRWSLWLNRVDIRWAKEHEYAKLSDAAQGHELYRLLDASADVSVICDADSLLMRPLPLDFLEDVVSSPKVCGVIAHYPPPLVTASGTPADSLRSAEEMWQRMAGLILGRPIELETPYTLPSGDARSHSFYINHAFLAGPPHLLERLHYLQEEVRPAVRSVLDNDFYDQIAVAFAVELGRIPHVHLPMRFNYPNDELADALYPEEMGNAILVHYLRTHRFDRHKIFATKEAFDHFMEIPLSGSNEMFRDYIRRLTGGFYPFVLGDAN
jgi:hypothetical protein